MLELLQQGQLQTNNIFDYLAYTVQISELATEFTWGSVLQYDDAYRRKQAQGNLQWGSQLQHIDRLNLKVREPKQNTGSSHRYNSNKEASTGSEMYCRLYQKLACPWGDRCRYPHVCSAPNCRKSHPLAQHREEKMNQGNSYQRD